MKKTIAEHDGKSQDKQISQLFKKVISEATIDKIPDILKALSQVDSETERAIYIEELAKKFQIGKREILKDIKNISSTPQMRKKTSLSSLTSLTPPTDLVEIIKTKEGLKYCLLDPDLGNFELKDSLAIDGTNYKLPQQVTLVNLPSERFLEFSLENDGNLFNEIEKFVFDCLDVQEDFGYKILVLWVFHTWLIDKFNTSPIIHFLGPYASGKSRGGDVLSILARRGLSTVNMTGASIFRVNEFYQPTFIIDEVKLSGKDRDRDILELLNARFQRGRKVIRINPDKTGLDSVFEFNVFGATVLCGLDELPETPKSRAIVFTMEQNTRQVLKSLDSKKADILRDKLCAFRLRHIEEKMPKVERFVKDGRLIDVTEPLHQVLKLVKPEIEPDFVEFFKRLESERREEIFDGFDSEVVRALQECQDKVEQDKILVSHVADKFNESKVESEKVSTKTIGRILTRLGLKKMRTTGGARARLWDKKKVERLCKKFCISDVSDDKDEKTESREKRLSEPFESGFSDDSDDSDVFSEGERDKKYLKSVSLKKSIKDYGESEVEIIDDL